MASLSVDDCIHAMFEKHVLWKPRQYQVDAIRDICADDKHTLVVKGTGQGKTWVLLGAFLLRCGRGGVGIVVVPTIALGASAARSAQKKLPRAWCLHVNTLTSLQQEKLLSMVSDVDLDKPILIYISAERATGDKWHPTIVEASKVGNIKFIGFDEVHTYYLQDFRQENRLLASRLVAPVLHAPATGLNLELVPILALTATLDATMLKCLQETILKVIFASIHWGNADGVMPRRNICMSMSLKDNMESVQQAADEVISSSPTGTLITYFNFAKDASKVEDCLDLPANCDSAALVGEEGDVMKSAYVRELARRTGESMRVRVIGATAAADTGLDVDTAVRGARRGFAPNLAAISQERGRIRQLGDGDYRYGMFVSLTLAVPSKMLVVLLPVICVFSFFCSWALSNAYFTRSTCSRMPSSCSW